jgi:hypothetical protein
MNRQLAANFNPNFNDRAFDRANRPFIDYRPTGKTPQPSKFNNLTFQILPTIFIFRQFRNHDFELRGPNSWRQKGD